MVAWMERCIVSQLDGPASFGILDARCHPILDCLPDKRYDTGGAGMKFRLVLEIVTQYLRLESPRCDKPLK